MRVLMVSWKDEAHPLRGGAERYTRILLEQLVRRGHSATWLTSRPRSAAHTETTPAGVEIVRAGTRLTIPFHAWDYLRSRPRDFDVVIDQVNTYPMFVALHRRRRPVAMLIHQLAADVWDYEAPRAVAAVGRAVEPHLLRLYADRVAIAVSRSTACDLEALGFRRVHVAGNVLETLPDDPDRGAPPDRPLFVGLGRIVAMKRFEEQVEAIRLVRQRLANADLVIMGRGAGRYSRELERVVQAEAGATLLRDVSDAERDKWLARATGVVATSVREGWGLMVTEGHAHGTPSIVYDAPGLRDSTDHDVTGVVVPPKPDKLAAAMVGLAEDRQRWLRLSRGARRAAERLTPDRLGRDAEAALTVALEGPSRRA